MRKVYVNLKVRLVLQADDEIDFVDALSEMDYLFTPYSGVDVVDSEITDWEVKDSK